MTETALRSHVALIRFKIAVHYFQFQYRTFCSFSEWNVLNGRVMASGTDVKI